MSADVLDQQFLEAYGVVIVDRHGHICVWSKGAERILGHSEAEVIGSRVDILVPEPYREMHWQGFFAAMEKGGLKNASPPPHLDAVCKSGEIKRIPARLIFLTDSSGQGVGAMGIFG